jgi:hypothetical protein
MGQTDIDLFNLLWPQNRITRFYVWITYKKKCLKSELLMHGKFLIVFS